MPSIDGDAGESGITRAKHLLPWGKDKELTGSGPVDSRSRADQGLLGIFRSRSEVFKAEKVSFSVSRASRPPRTGRHPIIPCTSRSSPRWQLQKQYDLSICTQREGNGLPKIVFYGFNDHVVDHVQHFKQ